MDESVELDTSNTLTPPSPPSCCVLNTVYPVEQFTIQMDESVNDSFMHALVSSMSQKHANNIHHLSFEGMCVCGGKGEV